MDQLWSNIVESYSPQSIEFIGTLAIQILTFWIPSLCYLLLDILFPTFSHRHKIQPAAKQPTRQTILHCFYIVARNQLLTSLLHLFQIHLLHHQPYRITSSLPSLPSLVYDFILSLLLREILFYYTHRLLHHPSLYSQIHKVHHKFTAPIALSAQYAHPIEQVLANVLPIALPPQILRSHVVTFWVFLGYELLETGMVHSGFDFWGVARMHDLHHERFRVNFGGLGVLDWVHGTLGVGGLEGVMERKGD
ncbi:sterol desaturase family protein [Aspergillus melleus]|uniref:sterol desaturase family protein n=1 Tax=Aspergillus melleus TaxID=138277 RepID=UPI001E8E4F9D|nr:uncharacterized protein LDX57_008272 [Aspergillus melleus]KAH8430609.1 hypothetical protein LDX57_008272 [Aspergillus melleus]